VEELLQGRVPGLQVVHLANGDVSLRIRGGSVSLLAESERGEPLLVIDGMPVAPGHVTRALRSLNPREIARIEVLKDVSSTSSYGMAGAHGVILITTKRD
jgi:TonB-dependent SusC/RagA subfamily outer membrane receptor